MVAAVTNRKQNSSITMFVGWQQILRSITTRGIYWWSSSTFSISHRWGQCFLSFQFGATEAELSRFLFLSPIRVRPKKHWVLHFPSYNPTACFSCLLNAYFFSRKAKKSLMTPSGLFSTNFGQVPPEPLQTFLRSPWQVNLWSVLYV